MIGHGIAQAQTESLNVGETWFRHPLDELSALESHMVWSCAAAVVATMLVGFAWGGWVTGRTADQMAKDAAGVARKHLIAQTCVSEGSGQGRG